RRGRRGGCAFKGLSDGRRGRAGARVWFEHDQIRPDLDHLSRRAGKRKDTASDGGRHLDRCLIGHDLGHELVFLDEIADLDVPSDDLPLDSSLAQVRHPEDVSAHRDSITVLSAPATRACPGKYSHSKACGYGVSQPATRRMGASSFQKHASWIDAESSAPKPEKRVASCAMTQRPVLLTEAVIVSMSS